MALPYDALFRRVRRYCRKSYSCETALFTILRRVQRLLTILDPVALPDHAFFDVRNVIDGFLSSQGSRVISKSFYKSLYQIYLQHLDNKQVPHYRNDKNY